MVGHNVAWSQVFMVTKLHSHNKSIVTIMVTIVHGGNVVWSKLGLQLLVTSFYGHKVAKSQ